MVADPGTPTDATTKRPVAVLGAGLMGSAVIRTLMGAGHPLTLWNRTPARLEPFAADGARIASSPTSAVEACSLVLSMLLDDQAIRTTLAAPLAAGAFRGRILLNLTTGTPDSTIALADLIRGHGGRYLDGVILGYPDVIGRRGATILCAGPEDVWAEVADVVLALGGRSHLVGPDVAVAAVIDSAVIGMFALTTHVATLEAIAYADSFGVSSTVLQPYLALLAQGFPAEVDDLAQRVAARRWTADRASLTTVRQSLDRFASSGRDAGLPDGTVAAAAAILTIAEAHGHGNDDLAALPEALRQARSSPRT